MSSQLREMEDLARSYCELVEAASERDETWIQQVAGLLPQLHMAITALGGVPDDVEHNLVADLDARFELYGYLRKLLGDRDAYWMEFDAAHDKQCMSGSLADDLTDIYCELKLGLKIFDGDEPERAIEGWHKGYHLHWGQHLVDAERHLYELRARNQIEIGA